jgi:hypothetical protein
MLIVGFIILDLLSAAFYSGYLWSLSIHDLFLIHFILLSNFLSSKVIYEWIGLVFKNEVGG